MVQPIGDISSSAVPPPAETPGANKPRRVEDEKKFAHQLEQLVVKEEKESEKVKKVGDQESKEQEKKRGKNEKNQQTSETEDLEPERKGHKLDISV